VYPNPATDRIFIDLHGEPFLKARAELTDLQGKTMAVKELEMTGNFMELTKYTKGIYLLKLVVDGKQDIMKISIL
jgi:hypothetical protein